jgi:lysophospholipase L1-like esterase
MIEESLKPSTHIVFGFGASSLYGAWDTQGGWFGRLRNYYDTKNEYNDSYCSLFYNLAVDGETTNGTLRRFENEIRPRASKLKQENVVVFDLGKNDSAFIIKEKKNRTSPDSFANNLRKLHALASNFASKIVFVGVLPILEENDPGYKKWIPEFSWTLENLEKYGKMVRDIASETKADYIDLREAFDGFRPSEVLDDGLHLNWRGHEITFNAVRDFFINNNILD